MNSNGNGDAQVIRLCLKGDRMAQKKLYDMFAPKMYGICLRYARDQQEASDFLQEGFIAIFNNLKKFRFEGSFEGWVRRIIINTALQHLRKKVNIYEMNEEIHVSGSAYNRAITKMSADQLMKYINELPDGYRLVFNLYVIEEYTHKEIAEKLNITEGTSKSQLSKARKFLKEKVKVSRELKEFINK